MMPQASPLPERSSGPARPALGARIRASGLQAGQAALQSVRPASSALLLGLFVVSLLLPINPALGDQRLTPSRIYLILVFVPFTIRLLSGKAGRLTWVDGGMAIFSVLMVLTLLYHHGPSQLPYGMSQGIEMFGGYMTGRLLVRNVADYQRFIRYFLIALMIILPLAVYELLNSRMPVSDVFRPFVGVIKKNIEFRFDLSRVQVVFPHSILYGLFCSLALASVYYIYRGRFFRLALGLALVFVTTLMSLSSAPMISVLLQTAMVIWDRVTKGSWKLLAGIVTFIYVMLELFTNRGALVIFIETMTLDPTTGWWRIHIWTWGSRTVMNHPWIGIGMNDWVRPDWLTSSVDNFWLLMAMRHGLPVLGFILMAFVLHITWILRAPNLTPKARAVRTGYVITLIGLIFTLSTVDVWDAMSVFVMFFLGIGAFLYAAPAPDIAAPQEADPGTEGPSGAMAGGPAGTRSGPPVRRFPQVPGTTRRRAPPREHNPR